jgi:hypothetical protein
LNIPEIEIKAMDWQFTCGRIESRERLEAAVMIWSKERKEKQCNPEWAFSKNKLTKSCSCDRLQN